MFFCVFFDDRSALNGGIFRIVTGLRTANGNGGWGVIPDQGLVQPKVTNRNKNG